jgi:hypothetical protein
MTDAERRKRIQDKLSEEMLSGTPAWWYLSFASEKGFLGAVIIHALGMTDAIYQTHRLGIPEAEFCPVALATTRALLSLQGIGLWALFNPFLSGHGGGLFLRQNQRDLAHIDVPECPAKIVTFAKDFDRWFDDGRDQATRPKGFRFELELPPLEIQHGP